MILSFPAGCYYGVCKIVYISECVVFVYLHQVHVIVSLSYNIYTCHVRIWLSCLFVTCIAG